MEDQQRLLSKLQQHSHEVDMVVKVSVLQCVAVCCSVLKSEMCCGVLQCVVMCCRVSQYVARGTNVNVLRCVAVAAALS